MYGNRGFGGGGMRAPINEGDEVEVTIESVGEKGDGIARVKGFVVFIPGVKQGETVTIRITKVLRKFAFGEVADGSAPAEDDSAEDVPEGGDAPENQPEDAPEGEGAEDSESFGDEEEPKK